MNAQQLVSFVQSRLEFSEVDQKRYLAGLTVSRSFFYLSKNDVIADHSAVLKTRSVESFEGLFSVLFPGLCFVSKSSYLT